MASRHVFQRTVITDKPAPARTFQAPLNGDINAVDFKALIRRSANYYAVKVGAFGSPTRIGQAAQAVGTAFLPGNISPFKNPARSGVYSALTPGGGGGGSLPGMPGRQERGYRCPEGFQYGGRFTDSRFSTCGQMLFDIFGLGPTVSRLLKPLPTPRIGAGTDGSASPIPGLSAQDQQIIISRAAQIPRIGPADTGRKKRSITDAVQALTTTEDGVTLMVRRDGFSLRPVVSTAILRTVPDNRNMEGATFLTAASKMSTIGRDELGLLSNTGITELQYVAPNGVTLALRKTRPLTVGERRKLGKTVVQAAKMESSTDPTERLQAIVAASNGAIEYSESLGRIDNPNEIVTARIDGAKRQVRRWVYDTFVKTRTTRRAPAEETPKTVVPSSEQEIKQKIASLAKAVEHLNSGGDPRQVLPSLLPQALQRTRGYQTRRVDKFTKVHTRPGKHSITEHASEYPYEHLAARVSADIQRAAGLDAQEVLLTGQGTRSPYMTVNEIRPSEVIKPADNLDNLPPSQVLALAVSDYVLDHRGRAANTTQIVNYGGKVYLRSPDNKLTLLTGIPNSRRSARQEMGIDAAINADRADYYSQAFRALSETQRRSVVKELDAILERLQKFSWEEYVGRLKLDGRLSAAEETHLGILKSIVTARLGRLQSSKKKFLELLSAQ